MPLDWMRLPERFNMHMDPMFLKNSVGIVPVQLFSLRSTTLRAEELSSRSTETMLRVLHPIIERMATYYFDIHRNEMEDKGSQWKSVLRGGEFILCSECVNFLSSSKKCSSVHTGCSKERGEESSPSHIRSKHSHHTSKAITPAHHNSNSRSSIKNLL